MDYYLKTSKMYKKIIFSVAIFLIFNPLSAQKSLNIDSVFTISMNLFLTPPITVPVNKIWKIETMGQSCINTGSGRIELNGMRTDFWGTSRFPIWLGSGDNLQFISAGSNCWAYISIIQFTLN